MTRAGFPPFGHPGSTLGLAAPRGLSQPPTSFIGFWRLGIHRVPFVTWQLQDARARYVVLKVPDSSPVPAWPDVPAGSGSGQSLVARCSRSSWERSLKAQQCVRPGCSRSRRSAPPCGAVLGEPKGSPAR